MKIQFYSVFSYRIRDGRWEFLGTVHPHLDSFHKVSELPSEEVKLPKTMLLGRKQVANYDLLAGRGEKIYYVPTSW